VTPSLPLSEGLPLDATSWEQTPLVVRQVVVHLLAVIQQQEARIAALEARITQNSRNSDRPPRPIHRLRGSLLPPPYRGLQERSRDIRGIARSC
jgi:hypothetical protein